MEHYLLIGPTDLTATLAPDKEHQWHYAAPGEVAALLAKLAPKPKPKKKVQSEPRKIQQPKIKPKPPLRSFAGAYFAACPTDEDLRALFKFVDSYRVACAPAVLAAATAPLAQDYFKSKVVRPLPLTAWPQIVEWLQTRLFEHQGGGKINPSAFEPAPGYHGSLEFNGFVAVELEADFGVDFQPVGTYRWGGYIDPGKLLKVWPEYSHSAGVALRMVVYEAPPGEPYRFKKRWVFDEAQMVDQVPVPEAPAEGTLCVTFEAKGQGWLSLGNVHFRWSRHEMGEFLPGGGRIVDHDRREVNYYFNPGDLKPPLNVYFSGYRTAEGFEAFYMMRSFGAPFLLFADPRLEGTGFYLGSPEFEAQIRDQIKQTLDWLGFDRHQLNTSGISAGTFGALYYGTQLGAHSIIIGKPLANLGDVAQKEQSVRYGGFPTSLDIVNLHTSHAVQQAGRKAIVKTMNQRFWQVFDQANLDDTQLMLTYMHQDDYDDKTYHDMLAHLAATDKHPYLISRGLNGHHNDGSNETVIWFKKQYLTMLERDFNRRKN
ncbi:accessory Sec system protein Asp2 [Limosilactobacillus ingluviei]|uniref:accessory Sec system protein Asp2 n=1 Tax=Limosilactobacillus ingluviei TaxID=148604 RepID=UPI0024BBD3B4|nr:accessory Sec system protein Asp2 [Limosilactobacillus ingluviei]